MHGGREIRAANYPRRIDSAIDEVDGGFVGSVLNPNGQRHESPPLGSHAECVVWCAQKAHELGYRT